MIDFAVLLRTLSRHKVEFIVVGGAAAIAHGSARFTQDLDMVYRRSLENEDRLVAALDPYAPYLRGAPAGLPFQWDRSTVERGLNFTLTTTLGDIDLLAEIPGGGSYAELVGAAIELELFQTSCRCLNLQQLIRSKRAAGRPKDLEALAELEAIEEELSKQSELRPNP